MSFFNLHTHTHFSDGSAEPAEYIEEALRQGFTTLGFTDHSPVPFENNFAIDEEALSLYCETILNLRNQFSDTPIQDPGSRIQDPRYGTRDMGYGILILLGLEIDFIHGITRSFADYRHTYPLDYTIGSVHLVRNSDPSHFWFIDGPDISIYDHGLKEIFAGDIRKAVTSYYLQIQEMVALHKPDIVGHFDKVKMYNRNRYFSEEDFWYIRLIDETLDIIEHHGCVVEVNTRGIYKKRSKTLFPGPAVLKKIHQRNIPITLCSDAHKPGELSLFFNEATALLYDIGFREIMNRTEDGWKGELLMTPPLHPSP